MFIQNKDEVLAFFGKSAVKGILVLKTEKKEASTSTTSFTETAASFHFGVLLSVSGAIITAAVVIIMALVYYCIKKTRRTRTTDVEVRRSIYTEMDTLDTSINHENNSRCNESPTSSIITVPHTSMTTTLPTNSKHKQLQIKKVEENHPQSLIISSTRTSSGKLTAK